MDLKKYREIVDEELQKANHAITYTIVPSNWPSFRTILQEYIANIDEATEVYNMENAVKKEK